MATARTSDTVELDGQYRLLREQAGLVDRSERGVLVVGGSEAAEFVQGQLTNDIEALGPNEGCYSALLDRKGHMQADMRVLCQQGPAKSESPADRRYWIDTEPGATSAVRRHLDMYKIGREVELEDESGKWAITSLIGPAAAQLSGVPPVAPEHAHRPHERDGIELIAVATDLGVDLISAAGDRDALHASLARDGIAEVSADAAEILRVESGRPRFGAEMTAATIPAGGRDQRARRELHQGVLHRPGDRGPAALQGKAEPSPARASARSRRLRGGAGVPGRTRDRQRRDRLDLARGGAVGPGDSAPGGIARRSSDGG